ncbi:MAG: hypothetical protein SGBAC_010153, partial [Bacillariaceae sp.]
MPSAPKVKVPQKLKDMKMPTAPKVNMTVPKVSVPNIKMKSAVKNINYKNLKDIKIPSAPKVKVPKKLKETMKQLPSASANKEAVSSYLAKRKSKKDEKKKEKLVLLLQMERQEEQKHLQQQRLLRQQEHQQQKQQPSYEDHAEALAPCRPLEFPPPIERQYQNFIFNDMVPLKSYPTSAPRNEREREEEKEKEQEHERRELEELYKEQRELEKMYKQELQLQEALNQLPQQIVWREVESDELLPKKVVWHEESDEEESKVYDEEMKDEEGDEGSRHIHWQDFDEPQTIRADILIQPASVQDIDLQQDHDLTFKKEEEVPSVISAACFQETVTQQFENFDKTCKATMLECQPILQAMSEPLVQPTINKTENFIKKTNTTCEDELQDTESLNYTVDSNAAINNDTMNDDIAAVNTTLDTHAMEAEEFMCGIDPDFVQKSMDNKVPTTPNKNTTKRQKVRFATPDTAPLEGEETTPAAAAAGRRRGKKKEARRYSPFGNLIGDLSCGMIVPSDIYTDFYGDEQAGG